MAKQVYIHIPQPCHQKWSEMNANEQGAFCKSCQKSVIDFTNKTENEIYEMVTQANGKICGRFHSYQLNAPIRKTEIKKSFFNLKAIAASVLAFFSVERIFAGNDTAPKPKTVKEQKDTRDTISTAKAVDVPPVVTKDTLVAIKGQVIGEGDNEPIPFANIRLGNSHIGTMTDMDGRFILEVSRSLITLYTDSLIVSTVGYRTETVSISDYLKASKPIVLKMEMVMLGEMVGCIVSEIQEKKFDRFTDMPVDFELGPRNPPQLKGE